MRVSTDQGNEKMSNLKNQRATLFFPEDKFFLVKKKKNTTFHSFFVK